MEHKLNLLFFIKHEILFQFVSIVSLFFLAWDAPHCPKKNGSDRSSKRSRIFNASTHKANLFVPVCDTQTGVRIFFNAQKIA